MYLNKNVLRNCINCYNLKPPPKEHPVALCVKKTFSKM